MDETGWGRKRTVGSTKFRYGFNIGGFDPFEAANVDQQNNVHCGEDEEKSPNSNENNTTYAMGSEQSKPSEENPPAHFYDLIWRRGLAMEHGFSGRNLSTDVEGKDMESLLVIAEHTDGDESLGKVVPDAAEDRTSCNITPIRTLKVADEDANFPSREEIIVKNKERWEELHSDS
ncbi:hypothetical protein Dimus_003339 [Dionaea muscipula]